MSTTKENIVQRRSIGLGSSDSKMVAKIGKNGTLNEADRQRIAIMLGLEEKKQFSNSAMNFGNDIEEHIYKLILSKYPKAEINPFYQSEELSEKYGFAVFNHIDFEIETGKKLIWIENKATIKDITQTAKEYEGQLAWHYMLLTEKAKKLKKEPVLMLSHYQVTDYDSFISENFKIEQILPANLQHINFDKGLSIISESIKDFQYEKKEELYAENLPAPIQEKIIIIRNHFKAIDEAQKQIDKFKETMLGIMVENGIKSIKNEFLTITAVSESVSSVFDKKAFEKDNPELFEKYTKQQKRNPYIIIKTK